LTIDDSSDVDDSKDRDTLLRWQVRTKFEKLLVKGIFHHDPNKEIKTITAEEARQLLMIIHQQDNT
jgi:hypothetical protein